MLTLVMIGCALLAAGGALAWGWAQARRRADLQGAHDTALRDLAVERARNHQLQTQIDLQNTEITQLRHWGAQAREALAAVEAQAQAHQEAHAAQVAQITNIREHLTRDFAVLADQALATSRESFLALAHENLATHRATSAADLLQTKTDLSAMITPMLDILNQYQRALRESEDARLKDTGGLRDLLHSLSDAHSTLRVETARLVGALTSHSKTRGRWGEQQLRNVLEMSGLSSYSDFQTEVSVDGDEGRLRPDVVVRLPGGRQLVIDAKVSLNAFLNASESEDDEQRTTALKAHARAMRTHITNLSSKAYWEQFQSTDFVLMFIPGEHFIWAATEIDRDLYNFAFDKKIILATPATLVAVARTVAQLWRQEKSSENARIVSGLGQELYKRMRTLSERFEKLSQHLTLTVDSFNSLVGSVEGSVMPHMRKFTELEVVPADHPLKALRPVEKIPRGLTHRDFLALSAPDSGASEGARA